MTYEAPLTNPSFHSPSIAPDTADPETTMVVLPAFGRIYAQQLLPETALHRQCITEGATSLLDFPF